MKRRGFLGFMGGVIAAPKALPKGIEAASMKALEIPGLAMGVERAIPMGVGVEASSKIGWASERLKKLVGLAKNEEEWKIRTFWINGLDEDTAVLKSMSIGSKMRRSRRIQYFRSKQQNETLFRGIMEGIFKDE